MLFRYGVVLSRINVYYAEYSRRDKKIMEQELKLKEYTKDELRKMHWRERWEVESRREFEKYKNQDIGVLLEAVKNGRTGKYYQFWYALEKKGSIQNSAMVLWEYLRDHPGESNMLNRYHCAHALFHVIGMSDPASELELHKKVQWDHDGENARQEALVELKEIIEKLLAER